MPADFIDLAVDYEKLKQVGSIMGSGGMVVIDQDNCIVDIAKFFLAFTEEESCGKCTTCRDGSSALLEVLNRISEGKGKQGDLVFLKELCQTIKDSSLCGLGQTMPNPVLSTLEHFKDEYEAHINEKRCPALVCKALITYEIDADKCTGCMVCVKVCASKAISGEKSKVHVIDKNKCVKCGICKDVCKFKAIFVK